MALKPALYLDPATSSRALALDLEAAHEHCLLRYAQSVALHLPHAGAAWKAMAGGQAIYSGSSPFSVAVGVGLRKSISAGELQQIEDFYFQRRAPSAIEVSPYSDPALLQQLQKRGYRVGDVTTVLCLSLERGSELRGQPPHGLTVRGSYPPEAEIWADMIIRLFYVSDPGPDARTNLIARFRVPDSLNAFAFLDDRVAGVAGGMLPLTGDVAVLCYSGTLPEFRKCGIHAALLDFRLCRARERGCRLAMVSAIPGSDSERNLQRHGFQPAYQKHTYIRNFDH